MVLPLVLDFGRPQNSIPLRFLCELRWKECVSMIYGNKFLAMFLWSFFHPPIENSRKNNRLHVAKNALLIINFNDFWHRHNSFQGLNFTQFSSDFLQFPPLWTHFFSKSCQFWFRPGFIFDVWLTLYFFLCLNMYHTCFISFSAVGKSRFVFAI